MIWGRNKFNEEIRKVLQDSALPEGRLLTKMHN